MPGFGSLPGLDGAAGIPVPAPPENNEQQTTDDIHAIKQKYVDGQTNFRQVLVLTAYQALRFDMTSQRVNALSLTVTSGTIYLYLFDVTNNNAKLPAQPDLAVSAAVVPTTVEIMIPERDDYIIGIQEGGNTTAAGAVRIMKI
jgi:hypothetical protein